MKSRLRWVLSLAVLTFAIATPAAAQGTAPNRQAVVAQVIKDHSEINTCDEESLEKGRAAIVDWAAQRLNKAEGRLVWGRKSRGKPTNGVADRPNTDALTYLRADGKFEIYDTISGTPPCGATWDGGEPFSPGQNGYWVQPQLGPEGSTPPPPPPPPPADTVTSAQLKAAIAQLHSDLLREMESTLNELRGTLERDIAEHGGASKADVDAAIDAAVARLVVVGKTRTSFGHQHLIELGVSKK